MDSEDYAIFCQDNLLTSSFSAFEDMRRNGELVDFKITFQNRASVKVHRVVLAAAIPFFRTMFRNESEEITLREIDSDALESVINFAYGGKIEITSKTVRPLLLASKYMQFIRLQEACWEFLEKGLCPNNVLEVRRLAEDLEYTKFLDTVDCYIKQNFEDFSDSESFLNFPFLSLKEVISKREVKISTEEKMFDATIKWVKASALHRSGLLCELLKFVRLDEIKPNYLIEKVSNEELAYSSPQCKNFIEEAINQHFSFEGKSEFHYSSSGAEAFKLLEEKSKFYHPSSSAGDFKLHGKKSEFCHSSSSAGSFELLEEKSEFCHSSFSESLCKTEQEHDKSIDVTDDHRVYAVCAIANEVSVRMFDPESETWKNVSNYGGMHASKVLTLRKVIYIFGTKEIISFDLSTHKWNTVASVHRSVSFSGGVSHLNKIYFFGGKENLSNIVRCFNLRLNKWEKQDRMQRFVQDPGVASLEGSIYITGGRYQDEIYRAVGRYSPRTKTLNEISPMFSKRYDHGCASLKGTIYVCGGISHVPLCSAEVYDPLTNQWSFIRSMKEPRFDLSVISTSEKLYVTERLRSSTTAHNISVYDQENDEWKSDVPSLPATENFDTVFLASIKFNESVIRKDKNTKDKMIKRKDK